MGSDSSPVHRGVLNRGWRCYLQIGLGFAAKGRVQPELDPQLPGHGLLITLWQTVRIGRYRPTGLSGSYCVYGRP